MGLEVILLSGLVETCLGLGLLPVSLEHDGITCITDHFFLLNLIEVQLNSCTKIAQDFLEIDCPVNLKEFKGLDSAKDTLH